MTTMTKTRLHLEDLSTDILCQRILPYLDQLTCLIRFSQTSTSFRKLVFSSYCSSVWSSKSLDVCIDPQCLFGCGRKKISPALCYRIIENTDVVELRLHLPFCSFGTFQQSMQRNYRQSLRRLHLRFRQTAEGEEMVEDRSKSYCENHINDDVRDGRPSHSQEQHQVMLNSLIVYGWPIDFPLSHLKISQLCSHLEVLHFMESSPHMLLQALHEGSTSVCPHLRELCIQGEQDVEGVSHISSDTLRVLNLRDTSVMLHVTRPPIPSLITTTQEPSIPRPFLNLPALSRLELIDSHVLNISDDEVRRMVGALPIALRELELRINSSLTNCIITELSKRLGQLEVLSLHLPDEDGVSLPTNISLATVEALAAGCPVINPLLHRIHTTLTSTIFFS